MSGARHVAYVEDEEARAFCGAFEMEKAPTNPLHLFLRFKDIRHSLEAA